MRFKSIEASTNAQSGICASTRPHLFRCSGKTAVLNIRNIALKYDSRIRGSAFQKLLCRNLSDSKPSAIVRSLIEIDFFKNGKYNNNDNNNQNYISEMQNRGSQNRALLLYFLYLEPLFFQSGNAVARQLQSRSIAHTYALQTKQQHTVQFKMVENEINKYLHMTISTSCTNFGIKQEYRRKVLL